MGMLKSVLFGLLLPRLCIAPLVAAILFVTYTAGFYAVVLLWLVFWAMFLLICVLKHQDQAPAPADGDGDGPRAA